MLVVFSPIFVADKKLIFVYNFVGPLKVAWKCSQGNIFRLFSSVFNYLPPRAADGGGQSTSTQYLNSC